MMSKSGVRLLIATILAGLFALSPSHAAEREGSGTVTYRPVSTERSKLPDGRIVLYIVLSGVILADDESVPFHLADQECGGTTIIDADRRGTTGAGYCSTIDKDNDSWWIWWRVEGKGSVWEFVEGTGKYKGMKARGTTKTLVRLPDGRPTLRWQGTWRMK